MTIKQRLENILAVSSTAPPGLALDLCEAALAEIERLEKLAAVTTADPADALTLDQDDVAEFLVALEPIRGIDCEGITFEARAELRDVLNNLLEAHAGHFVRTAKRLRALLDDPERDEFLAAVNGVAAQQREAAHRAGRNRVDWLFQAGALAGKSAAAAAGLQFPAELFDRAAHASWEEAAAAILANAQPDDVVHGGQLIIGALPENFLPLLRAKLVSGRLEEARQHTIAAAAALANWHAALENPTFGEAA